MSTVNMTRIVSPMRRATDAIWAAVAPDCASRPAVYNVSANAPEMASESTTWMRSCAGCAAAAFCAFSTVMLVPRDMKMPTTSSPPAVSASNAAWSAPGVTAAVVGQLLVLSDSMANSASVVISSRSR